MAKALKWRFELYGWLIALWLVLGIMVMIFNSFVINTGLIGSIIASILGLAAYAKFKKKKLMSANFIINAILTYIVWIVIVTIAMIIIGIAATIMMLVGIASFMNALP